MANMELDMVANNVADLVSHIVAETNKKLLADMEMDIVFFFVSAKTKWAT